MSSQSQKLKLPHLPTYNPFDDKISYLTIAYFILSLVFFTLYYVAEYDNRELENRLYQCSGQYY